MTETQATDRAQILDALRSFICQRPGFETGNYASMRDYREDSREATRDRDDALAILRWVELSAMPPEYLTTQTGRLFWDEKAKAWDYHTGQYFPVEYRAAAARLLATALWMYWRDDRLTRQGFVSGNEMRNQARAAFRSRRVRRYFA